MSRKLSGPNHTTWAADMRERLQRRGLWDAVDLDDSSVELDTSSLRLSPTTRRQAERANRLIVDALEHHVLRDLLLTALPSNLWNVLEIKYGDQAFGSVLEKVFAYFDARVDDPAMPVEDHIASMRACVDTLATMGFTVSEDMQVMMLLRSLRGSRFAGLLKDARHLPHTPSLAEVVDKLNQFDVASPPKKDAKATVNGEVKATSSVASLWGSMSTASTPFFASHEVSEEVMYAFARAVHSPSVDSLGYPSSTSSSSTTAQPMTTCWCTHKHHHTDS